MNKDHFKYKKLNLKAEVILLELLENDDSMKLENVILQPDGGFNHSSRREVDRVEEYTFDYQDSIFVFLLARRGLFDAIPEGLTHIKRAGSSTSYEKKTDLIIQDIKRKKKEEKASRKFLAPFDQVLNSYRIKIESEERKVLGASRTGAKHSFYDILWDENHHFLSDHQKSSLFSILPLAHEISSEINLIALAFESILAMKVIAKKKHTYCNFEADYYTRSFSEPILGESFILGDSVTISRPTYHFTLGPIRPDEAIHFLPNRKHSDTLKLLEEYFVPYDVELSYQFLFETEQLLFDEHPGGSSNRLGCSIHI